MSTYCAKHHMLYTASCSKCWEESQPIRDERPDGWLLGTFKAVENSSPDAAETAVEKLRAEIDTLRSIIDMKDRRIAALEARP